MITVALLPGDGVGSEVLDGPAQLLAELSRRDLIRVTGPWPVGASSFAATGEGLPADTMRACEQADAILLGAVGEHPGVSLAGYRPELALIGLREHFDLRVSVRQVWRGGAAPLTFVRNLLGGAYGNNRIESNGSGPASDTVELTPERIRELADIAIGYVKASGAQLISVDKANLLATSRLWRLLVSDAADAAGIPVRHVYVDRMAYELGCMSPPEAVVLTEGLFGDILSDLSSGRAGSIALCGSASVRPAGRDNPARCVGLFEPVHGSAPLRAGQNKVNPVGGYLALAMLLEWFDETEKVAPSVRQAVADAVNAPPLTYDMAVPGDPVASTSELSARINAAFRERWG
ncbi:MAG TPA: isocitrate/isopropylmalate family dehydrogenase [Jatrophihabitantaceae bacterium]|jgi:isocitrate/isopropylmalate dehydrogenase|nr:isocitrate/isopropylmalate family dehydrogenase [Jatrophihabitantaceae bacterium]